MLDAQDGQDAENAVPEYASGTGVFVTRHSVLRSCEVDTVERNYPNGGHLQFRFNT